MKKKLSTIVGCLLAGYLWIPQSMAAPKTHMALVMLSAERESPTKSIPLQSGEKIPLHEWTSKTVLLFLNESVDAQGACDQMALDNFPTKNGFTKQKCMIDSVFDKDTVLKYFE
jgi:hypothetical protein